jgi:rhodanese-related sulfurtransferase
MDVPEVDIDEFATQRDAGVPVVDVRNPDEYEEAHIPGVTLIPMGDLVERVDEVPADGTVLVVCAVGSRSQRAAEWLRAQGIDAVNVAGGTMAWIDAGRPVETGAS